MRKFLDIFIIFILFIGAFFLYTRFFETPQILEKWSFRRQEKPRPSYDDVQKTKEIQIGKDIAIYNAAIETQDFTLCKNIENQDERIRCEDMIQASTAQKS
jgi:predicted membrane protein